MGLSQSTFDFESLFFAPAHIPPIGLTGEDKKPEHRREWNAGKLSYLAAANRQRPFRERALEEGPKQRQMAIAGRRTPGVFACTVKELPLLVGD
jgi:hypothetical protein